MESINIEGEIIKKKGQTNKKTLVSAPQGKGGKEELGDSFRQCPAPQSLKKVGIQAEGEKKKKKKKTLKGQSSLRKARTVESGTLERKKKPGPWSFVHPAGFPLRNKK